MVLPWYRDSHVVGMRAVCLDSADVALSVVLMPRIVSVLE
jgi:hypothetical protein